MGNLLDTEYEIQHYNHKKADIIKVVPMHSFLTSALASRPGRFYTDYRAHGPW